MNSLRQVGIASRMYADDNNNRIGTWSWEMPQSVVSNLLGYGFDRDILYCASFAEQNNDDLLNLTRTFKVLGYAFATKGSPALASSNVFERNLLLGFPMASTLLRPRFLVATNDQAMVVISQSWMGGGPGIARLIGQLHRHGEVNPAGSSLRGQFTLSGPTRAIEPVFKKGISGAHRVLVFGGKQMPGRDVVPSS